MQLNPLCLNIHLKPFSLPRKVYYSGQLHDCLPLILSRPLAMSSLPRRHDPPTYDEDQAADPYVYDDGNIPSYDNTDYLSEDPYPQLADDERQETDEDVAMTQQREADAEVAADAEGVEGDIDDPQEEDGDWYEEDPDEENVRREMAERESGFHREQLDDIYNLEEEEE